jgi:hypothetical protein
MVLAGCGGSLLSLSARTRALWIATWCVVITGLLSVARGTLLIPCILPRIKALPSM